ncbi:MAG: DNA primase [Actinomycetia bacterium]|nr:DNA primase [Actinomycetes bacterium]
MISEDEIGRVRDATDLVQLIGTRVVLRQRRNEFWGCCPFHNEKTPSFKVDPVSQFYHCFGCGEHGDVFTFTMKTEQVEFPDAVRILAQRAGIELAEDRRDPERGQKSRLLAVVEAAADFYHQQLMRVKSPEADAARAYLAGRGFGGAVARAWGLGFAPGKGSLLRELRSKGFSADEMIKADLARYNRASSNGGFQGLNDRFFDRIMFPICDLQGRPIAFGGRVFLPGDMNTAKYLNSSETLLFKKRDSLYAVDRAKPDVVNRDTAIVVEGYTDAIALHQVGLSNTVATLGTALTPEHLKVLSRFTSRVVLLFDGDEAGRRAADRALELIGAVLGQADTKNRRADVYVALLPGTLDPAEFVFTQGQEALQGVVDGAEALLRYGLRRVLAPYDLGSPEQKNRAYHAALGLLAPLRGSTLVQEYLRVLTDLLPGLEYKDALSDLQKFEIPRTRRPIDDDNKASSTATKGASPAEPSVGFGPQAVLKAERVAADGRARLSDLERELISLYIAQPSLRPQLQNAFPTINWRIPEHQQLVDAVLALGQDDRQLAPPKLLALLTARLPEAVVSLSAARIQEFGDLAPERLAELLLFNIRELELEASIRNQGSELRRLNAMSGQDAKEKATELFHQITGLQQELADLRKLYRGGNK